MVISYGFFFLERAIVILRVIRSLKKDDKSEKDVPMRGDIIRRASLHGGTQKKKRKRDGKYKKKIAYLRRVRVLEESIIRIAEFSCLKDFKVHLSV